MTNPVIEAMARAMYEQDHDGLCDWTYERSDTQDEYHDNARVALQALKDNVSPGMLETLMKHCPLYADGTFSPSEAVSVGIGAMIDTAMKELE